MCTRGPGGFLGTPMRHEHRSDYAGKHDKSKTGENDWPPVHTNPKSLPAVAAAVNLGSKERQSETLEEVPAASFDVIGFTAGTLHERTVDPDLSNVDFNTRGWGDLYEKR